MKRRRLVSSCSTLSQEPVAFARARMEKAAIPKEPKIDGDPMTFLAYSKPVLFEKQQRRNGHLSAEREILGLMMRQRQVGETVVSLACGSGWLDRELVRKREETLVRDKNSRLWLLGVDSSPESKIHAEIKMLEMIRRNPALEECYDNNRGRLRFQYITAMLGSKIQIATEERKIAIIPSFAEVDLERTVIESKCPDTFILFYALTLWVQEREAAIEAIAKKCRKASPDNPKATIVINGEEFPTHLTPNPYMTTDFRQAVEERRPGEMPPEEIWNKLFREYGLVRITQGVVPFGLQGDNHMMKYALLRYYGND